MKTCNGCIHRFETSECVECVVTGLDHKNFESLEDVKRKEYARGIDELVNALPLDRMGFTYMQSRLLEETARNLIRKNEGEQK